ncbi:Sua5/YciO/YrdC/YwlC family protein [Psychrobium sp. nBUS_13]|uniref:Sua5/YciO/YrdC/YwlC family protein n=1 Tax=Psychrobium sp. nBUS_13 TaxID=3395319 RepID=UPI003EBEBD6A
MTYQSAQQAFLAGGLIAYPTEAVFGVGCDPDNKQSLERLLAMKQRDPNKGLILLASSFEQLMPYIDHTRLTPDMISAMLSQWPNGVTQVVPKAVNLAPLLSGQFESIAVRVTDQPDVVALCDSVGRPIVSTSANLSGVEPATTWQKLDPQLIEQLDYVIKGTTLGFDKPSTIIDAISGQCYR